MVTGTLETLSRNEAEALIVKNGGKASGSVQRKRPMSWQARQQAQLTKAQVLGIPVLTEAEFLAMISDETSDKTAPMDIPAVLLLRGYFYCLQVLSGRDRHILIAGNEPEKGRGQCG